MTKITSNGGHPGIHPGDLVRIVVVRPDRTVVLYPDRAFESFDAVTWKLDPDECFLVVSSMLRGGDAPFYDLFVVGQHHVGWLMCEWESHFDVIARGEEGPR